MYEMIREKNQILVNGYNGIGYKEVMWDGSNNDGQMVTSGIYFCRIIANSISNNRVFEKSIKLLLIK